MSTPFTKTQSSISLGGKDNALRFSWSDFASPTLLVSEVDIDLDMQGTIVGVGSCTYKIYLVVGGTDYLLDTVGFSNPGPFPWDPITDIYTGSKDWGTYIAPSDDGLYIKYEYVSGSAYIVWNNGTTTAELSGNAYEINPTITNPGDQTGTFPIVWDDGLGDTEPVTLILRLNGTQVRVITTGATGGSYTWTPLSTDLGEGYTIYGYLENYPTYTFETDEFAITPDVVEETETGENVATSSGWNNTDNLGVEGSETTPDAGGNYLILSGFDFDLPRGAQVTDMRVRITGTSYWETEPEIRLDLGVRVYRPGGAGGSYPTVPPILKGEGDLWVGGGGSGQPFDDYWGGVAGESVWADWVSYCTLMDPDFSLFIFVENPAGVSTATGTYGIGTVTFYVYYEE